MLVNKALTAPSSGEAGVSAVAVVVAAVVGPRSIEAGAVVSLVQATEPMVRARIKASTSSFFIRFLRCGKSGCARDAGDSLGGLFSRGFIGRPFDPGTVVDLDIGVAGFGQDEQGLGGPEGRFAVQDDGVVFFQAEVVVVQSDVAGGLEGTVRIQGAGGG